jgi:hypothetical protein
MENNKDFLDTVRFMTYEVDDELQELAFELLDKDFSELTDEELMYVLEESGHLGYWALMYKTVSKKKKTKEN